MAIEIITLVHIPYSLRGTLTHLKIWVLQPDWLMLPEESHGYRAKESILHMLWEQDQWLEKYVKNKGN